MAKQDTVIYIKRKRPRVQVINTDPSMTKQCFEDECNINKIMSRYEKTGVIEHVAANSPQYGDFSDVSDYQGAMNRVIELQSEFMTLPPNLRARFFNDPMQFIDFVRDPKNSEELKKLGLVPSDIVHKVTTSGDEKSPPALPVDSKTA